MTDQVTAAVSGIFIGAPRRTGKTTFMREDLAPALTAMGAYVIYVDL
jgi:predicted AAA+ superfamily ATPase